MNEVVPETILFRPPTTVESLPEAVLFLPPKTAE